MYEQTAKMAQGGAAKINDVPSETLSPIFESLAILETTLAVITDDLRYLEKRLNGILQPERASEPQEKMATEKSDTPVSPINFHIQGINKVAQNIQQRVRSIASRAES